MSDVEKDNEDKGSNMTAILVNVNSGEKSEAPDIKALKSLFKIALETRNFEITQLVQRNNFFMIFQGVLFGGVMQSDHSKPIVSFLVCFAGLCVSFYQIQMASGAKFWQEYWEQALHKVETELMKIIHTSDTERKNTFYLFHDDKSIYEKMVGERLQNRGSNFINGLIMKRYSVSRVPIYVASALTLVWFFLVICTLRSYPPLSIPSFIIGF